MNKHLLLIGFSLFTLSIAVYFLNQSCGVMQENSNPSLTGQEIWNNEYEAKKKKHQDPNFKKADKPNKYLALKQALKTREGESGPGYKMNYLQSELNKTQMNKQVFAARTKAAPYDFDERGPGNVPGRTRAFVIDPDDPNHWIAGAVGGGIWISENAGESWRSASTGMTNLAISSMAFAASNPNIIYAGTGEGWGASGGMIKGNGIYKSIDRGESWTQLASTASNEDFQMVNRIVVDPNDENTLLCANSNDPLYASSFNSGVFKSTDGGANWTKVLTTDRYAQQIIADPTNFDILYVAVRGSGVWKSIDKGNNWTNASVGLLADGRIELAISPVDPNRIFASVEGSVSGTGADLYISDDAADNWNVMTEVTLSDVDFLGGQGWYDNTLMAHPFDKDKVYVGGVNLFLFDVEEGVESGDPQFLGANENNTSSFFDLTSFDSGDVYDGKIAFGSVGGSDLVSIEVRFGNGASQMAHRFEVPVGEGAGVPAANYSYKDYVEVPFEVWDTDNNQQLMVSFRDQQRDGKFNLIEQNTDGDASSHSREYLYVHKVNYNATTPSAEIAVNGGHEIQDMYFFWPFLAAGGTWDPNNLPESSFELTFDKITKRFKSRQNLTDAYQQYSGKNQFSQTQGATVTEGVHPDNHNIQAIITDEANQEFQIIIANDGGLYKSGVGTNPGFIDGDWDFAGSGYNTTQFYAVDKAPGESRYIGGAQDNGTWMTRSGQEGSSTAAYARANGGDGFGVVWNYVDPELLLSSVYSNYIDRSTNGGASFSQSTSGLTDIEDDAPFITKLENVKSDPYTVYTVGASGVWKSNNFGASWALSPISDQWSLRTFIDVKISKANNNIVWAGSAMTSGESLHVSVDGGETFTPTSIYDEMLGQISGLATHPTEDSTAFVLFSFADDPKILKTEDLGQSWIDISGFGLNEESNSGFPDVAVYDLLVLPHETSTLWAGTEIGIFESTDDGSSWHILDSDFPPVSVWEIRNIDDQIVVGTHGRGIWSVTMDDLPRQGFNPVIDQLSFSLDGSSFNMDYTLSSEVDSIFVMIDGNALDKETQPKNPGGFEWSLSGNLSLDSKLNLVSYLDGQPYVSDYFAIEIPTFVTALTGYSNDFDDFSDDFFGNGFTISGAGLRGRSMWTFGDYDNDAKYSYTLNSPIIVSSDPVLNKIEFDEIVLIEPINDYAVVEASIDGVDWVEITERYDASKDADWQALFDAGTTPTSAALKRRSITLTDFFSPGDQIIIRFKLVSNESVTGWGWAIDNLRIQEEEVLSATPSKPKEKLLVYPNPMVNGQLHLTLANAASSPVDLEIRNHAGQLVYESEINPRQFTKNSVELDLSSASLSKGIYFIHVNQKGMGLQSTKFIVN
ncbi:T9SS type A sorting domain-containing protein [Reichenbachiella ulvae]|uniref:T9SS type A sorting domain-containing protein n=1 Tax=Reichenbachiella ulvae TaxID=2980104 RepID=A0ABT3CXI5_9BACT|nr:T9SS type A sorting domain-containing protein [Reichenbachiella ulvae]MCV9388407.1 T9SS type A sorting domain-containing protein [Reichenbachiella ulvae]